MEGRWRFPAANYGKKKGLNTGDVETFKKSPYASFAREILQNSIDAQDDKEKPVRVEFKTFEIETCNIPGINELKEQVRRCKEFYYAKEDYVEEYNKIEDELNKDKITCLRISDYNTTGLTGVETNENIKNHFLALTRGSGISEKSSSVAGGSKGVGKNAAFLMSKTRIVFYSTRTNTDINGNDGVHYGSLGVADFVSGYVDDDKEKENRDYTQGEGYFSFDKYNSASNEILDLSNDSNRKDNAGTDIYIIDFRDDEEWENEVITSILDSFLTTIFYNKLSVSINGTELDFDTLSSIIYKDEIKNKNIVSQYRLLTDENVKTFIISTDFGDCNLNVLVYPKNEEEYATNRCTMVRYPFMKIKDEKINSGSRVSAMCIIGNDKLGEILRSIENPKHDDWEPKRIEDKDLKKAVNDLLKSLKSQIIENINSCLASGNEDPLDPLGAGEFLPDENIGENSAKAESEIKSGERTSASKEKQVKFSQKNPAQESDSPQCLEPDIGNADDEIEGDVEHPSGNNNNHGAEVHGGDDTSTKVEGDNIIMNRSKLSGVKFKLIALDKKNGKFRIIFISPILCEKCHLRIERVDDTNNKEKIEIFEMSKNGNTIHSSNKFEYGPFDIKLNEKVTLDFSCDEYDNFASSINIICYEKGGN